MVYPPNRGVLRPTLRSTGSFAAPKVGDVWSIVTPKNVDASDWSVTINRGAGFVTLFTGVQTYTLQAGDIPPLGSFWPVIPREVVSAIVGDVLNYGNPYIVPVSLGLPIITGVPIELQPLTIYAPGFSGNGYTVVRTFYDETDTVVAVASSYTPPAGSNAAGKRYRITEVATSGGGLGTATSAGPLSAATAPPLVTLPTPILLQSYDSETGKTYAGTGTHSIVTGQVEGTGRQQVVSPGSSVTLFCTSVETGPFNRATLGTIAWRTTKDASNTVADNQIGMGIASATVVQSAFADSALRSRPGGKFVAVNMSQPNLIPIRDSGTGTLCVSPRISQITPFTPTVTFDAMQYNADGRNQIALIFDDCGKGQITYLSPLLDKYNIKATFAIAANFIGQNGKMDWDDVRLLQSKGHCIIGNTKADVGIVSGFPSDAALVADYTSADGTGWKEILLAQVPGSWPYAMALSNGDLNEARLSALEAAGLLMARTIEPQYFYNRMGFGANGTEKGQALQMPSRGVGATVPLATVYAQLDLSLLVGALQFIHGHNVDPAGSGINMTVDYADAMLSNIAARRSTGKTVIMTMKEVYDYTLPLSYSNPGA